jgi:heme-degrading monooxygenase HmoA
MYGTIAKMKILPGREQDLMNLANQRPAGIVFEHVYKLDSGNDEYMVVVGFESKDAYRKNAESPEMHQQYLEYRKFLAADPEWHDGEIIQSNP